MTRSAHSFTELLMDYRRGDTEALGRLMPLVHQELRRLATSYLRHERPGHTLQPTALVNEAFITLVNQKTIPLEGRSHFFAVAALAMRQVLVAYARKRRAEKRGHGWQRVTLEDRHGARVEPAGVEILALDQALGELSRESERQAKIVELRYFGGLSVEETALILGISARTVKREWMVARAWLHRRLTRTADAER